MLLLLVILGSFMFEIVEEEEDDELDDVFEVIKLKFCFSLYMDCVYLYDEVNYLIIV